MNANPNSSALRSVAHLPWRTVIDMLAFETAYRDLAQSGGHWASGEVEIHATETARELIVRNLTVVHEPTIESHRGDQQARMILRILPRGEAIDSSALYKTMQLLPPQFRQFTIVMVLDAVHADRWQCGLLRFGQIEPVEETRLVGAQQIRLPSPVDDASTTDEIALMRSSRFRPVVGALVYRKLQHSTVSLVGAGRNGWRMAFELAGMGIRRLRVLDPDLFQWENIDLMPGTRAADIGRNKAAALADALREFRPDLSVSVVEQSVINRSALRFLSERSDLIVTAVDNDLARLAVAQVAKRTLTVHLDVATDVQEASDRILIAGDARLLLPGRGCVGCVGSIPDLELQLRELAAPPGSLPLRRPLVWNQQRLGSLGTINAMTCGAAAQMWLDLLAGHKRTSWWQRLLWEPAGGLVTNSGPVSATANCPVCRSA